MTQPPDQDNDERALEQLLQRLLGPRPTAARRRELAEVLDHLAARQRALADAASRQERRPPAERVGPPRRAGGRPPGQFVRIEREARGDGDEAEVVLLHLGRGTYYAAGQPQRLDVQRLHGDIHLIPVDGNAGFAVLATRSYVRMKVASARNLLAHLVEGRYEATVSAGMIVIGERLDEQDDQENE
ncbi:MAG TPA: hypothetical protein VFS21_28540 [Roseiflexaceae bacterium]|nr:hypothetical protein [Roseiflexaceae bacterium]